MWQMNQLAVACLAAGWPAFRGRLSRGVGEGASRQHPTAHEFGIACFLAPDAPVADALHAHHTGATMLCFPPVCLCR